MQTPWTDEDKERFSSYLHSKCEWADRIMAADDVQYPNGRSSWDCADIIGGAACDWLNDESYLSVDPLYASDAFDAECNARLLKEAA